MRRTLDLIYDAAAWIAAFCMVGVLAMVLTSIVSRQIGVHVPGTDAYAGYMMAGAGFLALAHTLRRGEHIRVTLLVQFAQGGWKKAVELWAFSIGALLAGLFAFYSVKLAIDSHSFNDISTSNDATPLWIPQISMALGTVVLLIAILDGLVAHLRGTPLAAPAAQPAEPQRFE